MNDTIKRVLLLLFLLFSQICPAQQDECYTIGFNAGKAAYARGETHLSSSRYEQAIASFKEAKDHFVTTKDYCRKTNVSALNEWIRKCDDAIQRVNEIVREKTDADRRAKEKADAMNIEMVYVQGGTFMMGCIGEQGSDCWDGEKPAHQVTLSSFYIGQYEVTQAQWKAVMGSNPSNFKGDNLPVEMVSWNDAQEFIRKLNAQTGKRYRLPTEAEWEYAARGGSKSRGYKYSGSNTLGNVAWYNDNSGRDTHPVGKKLPNELGIYDMSGNVSERCSDWYGAYPASAQNNPTGASSGDYRVERGGNFASDGDCDRVAYRGFYYFSNHKLPDASPYVGFRLACSSE
jgi:formylglycine-generating enzyme required for sulfatase activity